MTIPLTSPGALVPWQLVAEAVVRLDGVARRTPLVEASDLPGCPPIYLKAECLQRTHAFKFRGAYNRVALLTPAQRAAGLIAASSGNHALGLSLAGAMWHAPVTVVMPEGAPAVKAEGCARYGATVVRHGEAYDDALAHARGLCRERDLTYVQSFDDPLVAAGQASVAWEILQALPDVDVIVAPVGGGGLLAGIASLVKGMPEAEARLRFPSRSRPLAAVLLIGVQAAGAPSMVESARAGRRMVLPSIATIADGIAVREPGSWTCEVVSSYVDDLVVVTDEEMLWAMGQLLSREKLVVEPAGAAAVAAVATGRVGQKYDLRVLANEGLRIACVLSGGNVGAELLARALEQRRPEALSQERARPSPSAIS